MESLFILIPVALVFLTVVILVFFWAVKSGQFEDFDTEARRILFDDEPAESSAKRGDEPSSRADRNELKH